MGHVLKYIALTNLLLATAAHVAAYVPGGAVPIVYVLPLFLLLFPLLLTLIVTLNSAFPRPTKHAGEGPFAFWARLRECQKAQWKQMVGYVPWGVKAVFVGVFLYVFLHFFACMSMYAGGTPQIRGDKFVLVRHTEVIRELSAAEFQQFEGFSTRLITGHIIVFSFVVLIYFQYIHPQVRLLAGFNEIGDPALSPTKRAMSPKVSL